MKYALLRSAAACALLTLCSLLALGQVATTGSISGTVTDPSKAVVAGATVVVKNNATGIENTAISTDNGTFSVPALPSGIYTVTITAASFKKTMLNDVKVNVGTPSNVNVELEVGAVTETVTITGAGGELLQTQSATVGTTITGRQITELPFASRDALDLVLLLPGTATPGRPRTSSVNGLPKGSLNITLDGINVQDNNLKSSDGFFTYVRPRIDAIDEVTLSTATPGAESSGEGAVQIKFITRGGTNDFRGSLYWYHRNPALNANYYFNNLAGLPRDRILLNQYGGRVGGPVRIPGLYNGKDKTFFFTNIEQYRLPEQTTRQRTILNPLAETGLFTYGTGANARTVNLLALPTTGTGCSTCTTTIDPTIGNMLSRIRKSTSLGSLATLDPNRQQFSFTNTGGQRRYFTTVRFDHSISSKQHLENIWNYQAFRNGVDFLNSADPSFPGFIGGVGGQNSNRFSNSTALRSTFTPTLINEARFGITGGSSLFRANMSPATYADQGGFAYTLGFGLTNPQANRSSSRRNSPVKQFEDTMTWSKGAHSINFGGTFSQINLWSFSQNNLVPQVTFGIDTNDPANALFNTANGAKNLPGASSTDLTNAAAIYALLTGRVTGVAGNAYLDENGKFTPLGGYTERMRQREFGFFAQDSWRYRPNITLNYGARYEVEPSPTALNSVYALAPFSDVFGRGGTNGLFNPTANGGRVPQFNQFNPGDKLYKTDWNNVAPSLGIAYTPNWKSGIMHSLLGAGGQTVLRAGYSISFVREGTAVMQTVLDTNPPSISDVSRLTTNSSTGNYFIAPGTLLRNLTPTSGIGPTPASPAYPFSSTNPNDQMIAVNPSLKLGNVQSWTVGIQREIGKDMVFEARYVGNRGKDLWRLYSFNEINVIENGFMNEFRLAQQNLIANSASGVAARVGSFAYFGPGTGTSALPIILGYFRGCVPSATGACTSTYDPNSAAQYTSSNFTSSTFVNSLLPNQSAPQTLANNLFNNAGRRANALSANLSPTLFQVNPDFGVNGAFVVDNGGQSWYDGMTLELRRRMAKGLLIQGNYTYSKAESNAFASSSIVQANYGSLRNKGLDKVHSPFDIRHSFKVNWIYELPFGKNHSFLDHANGFVDKLVGGWEFHGTARVQSGSPFNLGNVQLVGMSLKELQHKVEIYKLPTGEVYFFPQDLVLNTQRAFNQVVPGLATSGNPFAPQGYSSRGVPTGQYIAPAGSNGCLPVYTGACGYRNVVLYGPKFNRWDLSFVKKTRITETANLEFRTELLNAFNNINFKVGSAGNDTTSVTNFSADAFGRTTTSYQDLSTTNDPGARLIQFVIRINF
jgi:hypothetical protein